eukprot:1161593-Pelagomonas_calceolata.AAC.16
MSVQTTAVVDGDTFHPSLLTSAPDACPSRAASVWDRGQHTQTAGNQWCRPRGALIAPGAALTMAPEQCSQLWQQNNAHSVTKTALTMALEQRSQCHHMMAAKQCSQW